MEESREKRFCQVCGRNLCRGYYYTGRCAQHQTTKAPNVKLTHDAVEAKQHGLSYGQLIAAKREGSVNGSTGKGN